MSQSLGWIRGITFGLVAAASSACSDAGGARSSVPLEVQGSALGSLSLGGWEVTLQRADLAFGPLTLCAGEQAGELCDTALAEWRSSVVVDALSDKKKRAGALEATSGTARSFMYDLGRTSLLTQDTWVSPAAETLDGASVVLEGRASQADRSFDFSLSLELEQSETTEIGVPLVRKPLSVEFAHAIEPDERLRLRFSADEWIADVDFEALYPATGSATECNGACAARVEIGADTQAARAVRNALLSRAHPEFQWYDGEPN